MKRELELYLHIPFCVRKCAYCDFLSAPATEEVQTAYIEALKEEIRLNRDLGERYEVVSVFFGGGTPSLLPGEKIREVMEELRSVFEFRAECEISLECNPGTLDRSKVACYKEAGINRLSIGLQSACNEELKLLGRIHTWEEFLESYRIAREGGFSNINVDLMSALPGQSLKQWLDSLAKVVDLGPEHISAYSLIIEEGTPFYERYGEDGIGLPDEDTERNMYYETKAFLEKAGYHRYEISNYAKVGKECRHNLGYWRRVAYKGFGIGAASLLGNVRYQNATELKPYLERKFTYASEEKLRNADILSETMFLGLRTMEGVKLTETLRHAYEPVLRKYIELGFLKETDGFLRLTERGIDVSNGILAEFLLEEE